jgi:hypothetical protein
MPRQQPTAASRRRGPWLARLTGLSAVVLIAGGGTAAYVVEFHPSDHHPGPLPTKAAGSQTVGLIAQVASSAGSSIQLVEMVGMHGAPTFSPLSAAAANGPGDPEWTAEQITGGTFIFDFYPDGRCLGTAAHSRLALQHCDISSRSERWRRVSAVRVEDGHDFYQYANLAVGKCIAQIPGVSDQQPGVGLLQCSKAHPSSQMLAFWWLTVPSGG